jgi:hypothetical protein
VGGSTVSDKVGAERFFVWNGRIDVFTNVVKAYRNLGNEVEDGKPFSEAQIDVDRSRLGVGCARFIR